MIPARHRLQLPPGIDDERARALLELLERRFGALPVERVLVYLLEHVPESALPALGWQFDIPPDSWAAADGAGRRQLIATALAEQRKRGTIGALLRALAATIAAPAFVHRHTLPLADGAIWSDGTFVAGADRHPGAYWLIVAARDLLPGARAAIAEIAAEWMRGTAHLKQIYLVDDASEFGDLGSYRTGPWSPASLSTVWHWWRGDDPDAVIVDGAYAEVPDRGSQGGALVQITPARRPLVSTRWRPGPAPDFDVEAGALVHSSPAADWSWLHDAETEALLLLRARRDPNVSGGTVLATSRFVSLETGIHLRTISGGRLELAITNGSGGSVYALSAATGNNAWLPGEVATVVLHKQGASWSIAVGGAEVLTGEATGAVATAPTRSLCLGTVLSEPNAGSVVEAIICRGPVDARDRTRLESYLERWEYADE